jgi:hypothetical protein
MDGNTRAARVLGLTLIFASSLSLACAAGSESMAPDGGHKGGSGGTSTAGTGGTTGAGGATTSGTGGTTGAGGAGTGGSGAGGSATGGATGTGGRGGTGGSSTGAGGVTGTGGTGTTMGSGSTRVDLTGKKALIIVDSPTSLDDGEILLQQVLQVRGMTVAIGGVTDAAMATGQNVILISSGTAADINTSFTNAAVPLIVFGNSYFQTMGLSPTGSANKGTIDGHTVMAVTDASTSLAGGMMVGATFTSLLPARSASLYWGTPGGQAIKVAAPMGAPTQGVAFAFEKGAMTATGTAPARRVCFAWRTNVLKDMTVDAFKLVDAAFDWTAGAK